MRARQRQGELLGALSRLAERIEHYGRCIDRKTSPPERAANHLAGLPDPEQERQHEQRREIVGKYEDWRDEAVRVMQLVNAGLRATAVAVRALLTALSSEIEGLLDEASAPAENARDYATPTTSERAASLAILHAA